MLVLALDTTTRQGSIALVRDEAVVGLFSGDPSRTHGERLPGDLLHLLARHDVGLVDIDLFAVAAGPGSFTGLRIGIAALQGLALANAKPLAGVSALDATYEVIRSHRSDPPAQRPDRDVCVWMDAQRGQVFSAVYRNGALVEAPSVGTPADILAQWKNEARRPGLFAGDGAAAYAAAIHAQWPDAEVLEVVPPLAPGVAALGVAQVARDGATPPDAIAPIYIRRSDAELARDRRAGTRVDAAPARP